MTDDRSSRPTIPRLPGIAGAPPSRPLGAMRSPSASITGTALTHPPGRIRALVVDDSAVMRQAVRRALAADPDIEVVDTARDGLDALLKVERLQPDVLTMDVEMPTLDGLSALRLLMERFPRPVVMLSSLTAAGTEATVRALALGAVDFLCKPLGQPGGLSGPFATELVEKVKRAARARVRRPMAVAARPSSHDLPSAPPPAAPVGNRRVEKLVVIGSSTGGPRALADVMSHLPGDLPAAVLIVQHLPAGFTRSLAERLDQACALTVAEARDGDPLRVSQALIAPGDFHLRVVGRRVALDSGPRRHGVRPSVDTTLETAAASFGPAVLTAILTGMGEDGTAGAREVRSHGGIVLAEDESTCVVFGMPRAVIQAGLADEVVPLDQMAAAITRQLGALRAHREGAA